jgi:hypothetical protein
VKPSKPTSLSRLDMLPHSSAKSPRSSGGLGGCDYQYYRVLNVPDQSSKRQMIDKDQLAAGRDEEPMRTARYESFDGSASCTSTGTASKPSESA